MHEDRSPFDRPDTHVAAEAAAVDAKEASDVGVLPAEAVVYDDDEEEEEVLLAGSLL